jgi:hydrocephalus-inducing protein
MDETQDLIVWAFPDAVADFKDELICVVKDNPLPVIIPLSCKGEKPVVELESDLLKFDRLILNQESTKQIVLKSRCTIDTLWKLNVGDKLPEEFTIEQTSGTLRPLEEKAIDVTFHAIKQAKFQHKLTLEVTDAEEFGTKQENKNINLEAEAFDINILLNFGNEAGIVDFGNIRVNE